MTSRCPATTRHTPQHTLETVGVQCKFAPGHDGDHAGHGGFGCGDIFWPQEAAPENTKDRGEQCLTPLTRH